MGEAERREAEDPSDLLQGLRASRQRRDALSPLGPQRLVDAPDPSGRASALAARACGPAPNALQGCGPAARGVRANR